MRDGKILSAKDGESPYLSFSNTGVISGRSANCLGNGQSEVFTGIARVAGSGGAIHFVALYAAKTRVLTWEGYPD
jgi:hypothetical protein